MSYSTLTTVERHTAQKLARTAGMFTVLSTILHNNPTDDTLVEFDIGVEGDTTYSILLEGYEVYLVAYQEEERRTLLPNYYKGMPIY